MNEMNMDAFDSASNVQLQAFRQFGAQSAKELLFEILKTEILRRRQYGNPRYITKSIG
jgi:hypothetical protein